MRRASVSENERGSLINGHWFWNVDAVVVVVWPKWKIKREKKEYQRNPRIRHESRCLMNPRMDVPKTESARKPWTRKSPQSHRCIMVENSQEYRLEYWATRSSVRSDRSFIRLLPTARFARALRCAHFARSLRSLPRSWDNEWLDGYFICVFSIFDHSDIPFWRRRRSSIRHWRLLWCHLPYRPLWQSLRSDDNSTPKHFSTPYAGKDEPRRER